MLIPWVAQINAESQSNQNINNTNEMQVDGSGPAVVTAPQMATFGAVSSELTPFAPPSVEGAAVSLLPSKLYEAS